MFSPFRRDLKWTNEREKTHIQIIPNEIILLNKWCIFGMEFCSGIQQKKMKTMKRKDKKWKKDSTNVHFVEEWNKDKALAVTS